MATPISFLHSVQHGAVELNAGVDENINPTSAAVSPVGFEGAPHPLVSVRAPSGLGFDDILVAAEVGPTAVTFRRYGTTGDTVTVRYQLLNWNIGRQP